MYLKARTELTLDPKGRQTNVILSGHRELVLEPGDWLNLVTPAGKLNVEVTIDTASVVCEDGAVAFSADKESAHETSLEGREARWLRVTPPADMRPVEEMDAEAMVAEALRAARYLERCQQAMQGAGLWSSEATPDAAQDVSENLTDEGRSAYQRWRERAEF